MLLLHSFFFLRLNLQHMEVPGLGVKLGIYITATATPDLICICNLCCNLQQCWILNPLRGARDQTHILMDTSRVRNSEQECPQFCFMPDQPFLLGTRNPTPSPFLCLSPQREEPSSLETLLVACHPRARHSARGGGRTPVLGSSRLGVSGKEVAASGQRRDWLKPGVW